MLDTAAYHAGPIFLNSQPNHASEAYRFYKNNTVCNWGGYPSNWFSFRSHEIERPHAKVGAKDVHKQPVSLHLRLHSGTNSEGICCLVHKVSRQRGVPSTLVFESLVEIQPSEVSFLMVAVPCSPRASPSRG